MQGSILLIWHTKKVAVKKFVQDVLTEIARLEDGTCIVLLYGKHCGYRYEFEKQHKKLVYIRPCSADNLK